ncbi:MAG: radical SAM protein [Candidatus Methanogaster sp.]|uniref:Radical SAM protein n=1 Tax=Candidatus Methanogaster sp. TaxID=3386292 RepID=A0AC61L6D4_9EURY|nr:MAG: radical SAM protein [ANME-2 cluster archaeon]
MGHLFGPVPSRRLGRSLGLDITPYKTCTFDCIYCQLGRTTNKTVRRREYIAKDSVLHELRDFLQEGEEDTDYITFAGSGEPTLHSGIGEMIDVIKTMTDIPVAVITNGSLLFREDVRDDLSNADLVLPSLDAATTSVFRAVDRPHESLSVDRIIEGLMMFREVFEGELWLEIMFVRGVNDGADEITALSNAISAIDPDRVQLNTVVRPPYEDVAPVDEDVMVRIQEAFCGNFDVEIIAEERIEVRADILPLLERRPLTLDQIAGSLGMHRNETAKYLRELIEQGAVVETVHGGKRYFGAKT